MIHSFSFFRKSFQDVSVVSKANAKYVADTIQITIQWGGPADVYKYGFEGKNMDLKEQIWFKEFGTDLGKVNL